MITTVTIIAFVTQIVMIGFLIEDQIKRRQDWRDNPLPTGLGLVVGLICFGASLYVTATALLRALA